MINFSYINLTDDEVISINKDISKVTRDISFLSLTRYSEQDKNIARNTYINFSNNMIDCEVREAINEMIKILYSRNILVDLEKENIGGIEFIRVNRICDLSVERKTIQSVALYIRKIINFNKYYGNFTEYDTLNNINLCYRTTGRSIQIDFYETNYNHRFITLTTQDGQQAFFTSLTSCALQIEAHRNCYIMKPGSSSNINSLYHYLCMMPEFLLGKKHIQFTYGGI